jgi:hypothetical protein
LLVAFPVYAGLNDVERIFTPVFADPQRRRERIRKKTKRLSSGRLLVRNGNHDQVTTAGKKCRAPLFRTGSAISDFKLQISDLKSFCARG